MTKPIPPWKMRPAPTEPTEPTCISEVRIIPASNLHKALRALGLPNPADVYSVAISRAEIIVYYYQRYAGNLNRPMKHTIPVEWKEQL